MGVQLPGAWQNAIPGTPSGAPQLAQGVGSALQQTAGVVAYPMQQFQVSPQVSNKQICGKQFIVNGQGKLDITPPILHTILCKL